MMALWLNKYTNRPVKNISFKFQVIIELKSALELGRQIQKSIQVQKDRHIKIEKNTVYSTFFH